MGFAAEVYPGGLEHSDEDNVAVNPQFSPQGDASSNAVFAIDGAFAASAAGLLNVILFELILLIDPFPGGRDNMERARDVLSAIIGVLVCAATFREIIAPAFREIWSGRFSRQVCESVAVMLLLGAAIAIAFVPSFDRPLPTLLHGPVVLFFLLCLERLQFGTLKRALKSRSRVLLRERVATARVVGTMVETSGGSALSAGNSERFVPRAEVKPGMIIRIFAGETVPADAEVVRGVAEVAERRFSAAAEPRVRSRGDTVFGGSDVVQGTLDCSVIAAPDDSVITMTEASLPLGARERINDAERDAAIENIVCAGLLFLAGASLIYWFERGAELPFLLSVGASVLLCAGFLRLIEFVPMGKDFARVILFRMGVLCRSFAGLRSLATVRNLLVDCSGGVVPGAAKILKLELLDDRLDKKQIVSVLFSLLSKGESDFSAAACRWLRSRYGTITPYEVTEFSSYAGLGVCGTIQGAELTVGSETLLIERGVHLQPGDIDHDQPTEDSWCYVAIGDEVVAKILVARTISSMSGEAFARLRTLGQNVYLAGLASTDGAGSQHLDNLGHAVGIEPVRVLSELKRPVYAEKIKSIAPVATYGGESADRGILSLGTTSMAVFNDLVCEIDKVDLVLFRRDFDLVADSLSFARSERMTFLANVLLTCTLGGTLVVLSFLALLSPAVVVMSSLLFGLFLFVNTFGLEFRASIRH